MRKLLRTAKRIANKVFGTRSDLLFWRFRHAFDPRWSENYISEESLKHPHRNLLVEAIAKYSPESVLEVGCASGPNLVLLSRKLQNAKLKGIDISKKAVETGRKYLKSRNVRNVELETGNVLNLKNFPDESYDVVFTDAALIYVDGNRIENVLKELVRIAKKAVIVVEWNTESNESRYVGHWAHNYGGLFDKIAPSANVKLTKITAEVWSGDWANYGHIIDVEL